MGHPKKKKSSLIIVILGFIIFTTAVYLTPEGVNPIPFFTLINAAVSGYFIYSQKKLYEHHLEEGGEKAGVLVPAIVSILWFTFIISAILYIRFGKSSELDSNPEKAFHDAAVDGDIDMIKRLIERGIDVNSYYQGRTALIDAAIRGRTEIVKLLIQAGANANLGDQIDGDVPPLYTVAMESYGRYESSNDILELLVDGGADINAVHGYGNITALMGVARNGNIDGVKFLVEKGADINIKDEYGATALLYAADKGHADIVKYLISKGADVHLRTKNGKTALSLAIKYKNDEVIKILKAKGAKE